MALPHFAFLLDENGDSWKGGGKILPENHIGTNLPGLSNPLTTEQANLFSIFCISLSILRNNAKKYGLINSDRKNCMKTKRSKLQEVSKIC